MEWHPVMSRMYHSIMIYEALPVVTPLLLVVVGEDVILHRNPISHQLIIVLPTTFQMVEKYILMKKWIKMMISLMVQCGTGI